RVDQGDHRGAGETPSVVIGGLHPARQHPGALPDHPRATPAPAYGPDGTPRQGADVAELTGLLDLGESSDGMRVIVRCERPRPGAQLRSEDVDGYRLTAFAANTTHGQLADLEVRHRGRARGVGRSLRRTDRSEWAPMVQAAQVRLCGLPAPAGYPRGPAAARPRPWEDHWPRRARPSRPSRGEP